MAASFHRGGRADCAADRHRPAIHRSVELAPKRRRGDCAELLRERFSFCPAPNRLGRERARIRGNGVSASAVWGRSFLQGYRCAGMDRTRRRRFVFRRGTALFFRIGAEDFRRGNGVVGDVFLRVRAAQHRGEPRFHARCAVAQPGDHWPLFFSALGGGGAVRLAGLVGGFGFAGVIDQAADGDHRSAFVLFSAAPESRSGGLQTADRKRRTGDRRSLEEYFRTLGALVLRGGGAYPLGALVLACASDRGTVLSASFFRRGRF